MPQNLRQAKHCVQAYSMDGGVSWMQAAPVLGLPEVGNGCQGSMARFRWGNSSNDLIAIRVELQCAGAPIAHKLGVRPMSSALSSTARIASAFQALCAPLLEHCLLAMTSAGTCRDQQGTIDMGTSFSPVMLFVTFGATMPTCLLHSLTTSVSLESCKCTLSHRTQ